MSEFESLVNEIEVQRKELETLQENFLKQNQEIFKKIAVKFFEVCPEVKVVGWSQYTPYFNDGDECTFTVNDVYFTTEEVDFDDIDSAYELEDFKCIPIASSYSYDDALAQYEQYVKRSPQYWTKQLTALQNCDKNTYNACSSMLKTITFNEDLMKAVFGDHVCVYITPTEVIVNEYDHD